MCPSRRSGDSASIETATITEGYTAPCGCGGWFSIKVVGGATGDYAGNHGDLSPGSTGADTDYYYGGNGTGVIISARGKRQSRSSPNLDWLDKIRESAIKDGASNTILAGELHIPYGKINTIPFNGPIYNGEDLAASSRVGGPGVPLLQGSDDPVSSVLGFGSWHPGVCNFVIADGSVQSLATFTDTVTLGNLCNRADGEVVSIPQ